MSEELITKEVLEVYGFICERPVDKELELDGIWYNRFNLCEDWYEGDFNFAVYVRGSGCMKNGYSIKTLSRLKELYRGITGTDLEKKIIEIPNKL